jgi:hypothetical protein
MMNRRRLLSARCLVDLGAALEGARDPVIFGVGWDLSILAAARSVEESSAGSSSEPAAPNPKWLVSEKHRVVRWCDGKVESLLRCGRPVVLSFVQPVCDGVLLAHLMDRGELESDDTNVVVVDWHGQELRRFRAGGGIQDLRVTRDGTVWVSYFDEGVFGNDPISYSGLVALTAEGNVCFRYDARVALTGAIADACAMNVVSERDVWLYFYPEFAIVRIVDNVYYVWNLGVSGARALAIADERVLLLGNYKDRSVGRIVELSRSGTAKVVEEVTVVDDCGEPFGDVEARGVGKNLYFFRDRRVYVLDSW